MMKRIAIFFFSAMLSASAWAGWNEGLAAYKAKDYATAIKEWQPLAEQGDADAQTALGVFYDYGYGVQKDISQALNWYRKAAGQGNGWAQNRLGDLYYNGADVQKDLAEAASWYRKTAEQGDANAQSRLGIMYANAEGVQQDASEAVKWFRKAAEQGNVDATGNLGWYTANGWGVEKNLDEGERLLKIAAGKGSDWAKKKLPLVQESKACLKKASTVIFGEALNCTSKDKLRNVLKNGGLKATREDDGYWYDQYDSSTALEGTSQMSVAYIKGKFAKAFYVFNSSMNTDKVVEVRNMVAGKYGKPASSSGDPSLGEVTYTWKLKDGIRVEVTRGWPDTTVYLAYIHPVNFAAMEAEQKREERAEQVEKHSKQNRAF